MALGAYGMIEQRSTGLKPRRQAIPNAEAGQDQVCWRVAFELVHQINPPTVAVHWLQRRSCMRQTSSWTSLTTSYSTSTRSCPSSSPSSEGSHCFSPRSLQAQPSAPGTRQSRQSGHRFNNMSWFVRGRSRIGEWRKYCTYTISMMGKGKAHCTYTISTRGRGKGKFNTCTDHV